MDDFSFNNDVSGAFAVIGDTTKFAEMNKGVQPMFFIESVEDEAETAKAGTLKMRDLEFVRLFVGGDPNSSPVHPVTKDMRDRFAEAYKQWKATRTNDYIDGTPLAAWPLASRGLVMELNALHIRSVEDLAGVSDANIARVTDGRMVRERAKAWLATNKDAGQAARYAAEAERLRDDNADLKRQLADLAARVGAVEGASAAKATAPAAARGRAA